MDVPASGCLGEVEEWDGLIKKALLEIAKLAPESRCYNEGYVLCGRTGSISLNAFHLVGQIRRTTSVIPLSTHPAALQWLSMKLTMNSAAEWTLLQGVITTHDQIAETKDNARDYIPAVVLSIAQFRPRCCHRGSPDGRSQVLQDHGWRHLLLGGSSDNIWLVSASTWLLRSSAACEPSESWPLFRARSC